MPDRPSYEQLVAENAAPRAENDELKRMVAALGERVAQLERRLAADSSNASRPPSSDAPWAKKPAKKRSAHQVEPAARQAARLGVVLAAAGQRRR